MKRNMAKTFGLAGAATLLLAFAAGTAAAYPDMSIGPGSMDQDRDLLQVRDGSCDATLVPDADRDQIQLRDQDRLHVDVPATGDQDRDQDRTRDRDRLLDGDCSQPCDNDGAQVRNRAQLEVNAQGQNETRTQTQERVRADG
jgi:hypothetical protein